MKFKQFLNEQEELELCEGVKEDIISILNTMSTEEISEFGEFLDNSLESDAEYFDEDTYTKEEVIEILGTLTSDDLDYAYYMLQDEDSEDESDNIDDKMTPDTSSNLVQEKVSRKMAPKNRNKGKKKFTLTKSELRRGKAARKKENRKNKVQKKKYRMKNKVNMKKYAANYSKDVAAGKHKKKIRR